MNGLNGDRFVTGTLTRPFSRQPQSLVPSPDRSESESGSLNRRLLAAAETDDADYAWRHKQAEIRELQAANRSLLRRVYSDAPEVQKTPPRRAEGLQNSSNCDEAAATGTTAVPDSQVTPLDLSQEAVSFADEQASCVTPSADGSALQAITPNGNTTLQVKPSPVGSRIVERSSVLDQANTLEIRRLTSCVAKLEGHLNAQEEVLAAERARHKEDIQHLQSEALEEKKRMRRENAKKVAELQARGEELTEEVQEANNKAKEAERTMHSRISSMRQSSQRLKNQLQAEQKHSAEIEENSAQREALEQSVAELEDELHGQEAAYAELHEEFAQQQLIASEEREALLKELADLSADASQVRQQCNELNHHKEEHETLLARWQSHASNQEESLQAQRELEEQTARTTSLLKEELIEAQKTATSSSDRHQALLEEIRDERQAAALQLEELMQEARAKQRILQDLLSEGVVSTEEVKKIAAGEGESLQSWAAGLPNVSRRKVAKHRAEVEPGLSDLSDLGQLRSELAEARANAKLRDELNEANLRLADQLTEANANLREELIEVKVEMLTVREGRGLHQEELEAFTHELHQLQRSIRSEMAAQTLSRSSLSVQASSKVPAANLREEHEQALQDLHAAKRAEAAARQDLEKQRSEMRKLREAHQMDMDALAVELQQFQEEHGQLEGKLRIKEEREPALRARLEAAQAQVLEESRQGRQQLQRQMRQFQAREREMEFATEQSQELQQHLSAQLADVESKLLVTKEQLQKVREDKMSERQRFERQLDKLRGELQEQQKGREVNDKGKSPGGSGRQSQEQVVIRNLRSMSKQLSMQLEASEERIEGLESTSESHANNLAEAEASAHKHRAALEERAQAAETWGKEMARRLQDAEDRHQQIQIEKEAHYRESHGHIAEARSVSSKLLQSLQRQVADILTLAGAAEVPHIDRDAAPEVLVTRSFAAVSQAVATLLRENTELRASHGMQSRSHARHHEDQTTALQQELQELRIQKQEWDLQKQRRNGQADQAEVFELKQRLKQLSQAKRRSDERVEEYQQELTRQKRQQQVDLERAQLDMTAQYQQFQAEQEQLNGKLSTSDRKAKMLEAKLKGRIESMRIMQAEKEAVEEQLRIAAKQLEALLADEAKDSDFQRDLAALSKQFEQLHAKHRLQLAKAEEHAKQLKHEQAARQALEARLADLAMAKRAVEGEAKTWQQQNEVLDKDLRAAQAAEAVATKELQRLQGLHGEDQRLIEELQHELRRLREDLHEARRATPQELILRLKRMEEELQHAEAARQQLEDRKERGSGSLKVVEIPSSALDAAKQPSGGHDDEVDVRALKEIQDTLAARERYLRDAKGSPQDEPSNGHGGSQEQTLADLERDFAEFARSVGFKGDVSQLWEEAQAAAAKEAQAEKAPVQKARRDERPVAADVQLRPSADSGDVPSPPRRGVPWKSSGAGVTPKEQETSSSKGVLPLAAQECFQQAEALCARQHFSEAVPLFRRTLEILQDASGSGTCAAAAAEVWAHLGVAMQSLDRVPEAIDSYRRAVAMDAGLHVCFANLATLHAYLHEKEQALEYIAKALEVEPTNPTYLALRSQFLTEPKEEQSSGESTSALGDQSSLGESSEPPAEFASTEGSKKSSRMS